MITRYRYFSAEGNEHLILLASKIANACSIYWVVMAERAVMYKAYVGFRCLAASF